MIRAGLCILVGHGNVAVTQGIADDGEWCLVIDGMGTMAMPQPVGGNLIPVRHASSFGGLPHNAKDGRCVQSGLPQLLQLVIFL